MRYTGDLGCRYRGIPHDLRIIHQDKKVKWERCSICNQKFKYNKGYRGRIANNQYLKDHIRSFCQSGGTTKAVYYKVYYPQKCIIKI